MIFVFKKTALTDTNSICINIVFKCNCLWGETLQNLEELHKVPDGTGKKKYFGQGKRWGQRIIFKLYRFTLCLSVYWSPKISIIQCASLHICSPRTTSSWTWGRGGAPWNCSCSGHWLHSIFFRTILSFGHNGGQCPTNAAANILMVYKPLKTEWNISQVK